MLLQFICLSKQGYFNPLHALVSQDFMVCLNFAKANLTRISV